MAVLTRMPTDCRGGACRRPFLILAYPTTFLIYQGGAYCRPVCFTPTLTGAGSVVGSIVVSLGLAYLDADLRG